jgi:hypothetical protein
MRMADLSRLRKRRHLPGAPPTEPSPNLNQPEVAPIDSPSTATRADVAGQLAPMEAQTRLDGRSMRRTNRTVQFATRVTPEFDRQVRAIAQRDGLMIVEVLERALDAFEGHRASGRRKETR